MDLGLFGRALLNNNIELKNFFLYKNSDHSDANRWLKRSLGTHDPLRIIKYTNINSINSYDRPTDIDSVDLLRLRFNDNNKHLVGKDPNNVYFAFKQKRYSVRKKFVAKKRFTKNINNDVSSTPVSNNKIRLRVLVKNKFFDTVSDKSATTSYKFLKKGKTHSDAIPVPLAKRILRTRRTLVLPAHVNITVITNSYDVVHAWFIPSLGVKMDCVPGRSTHHVLYIDSVGFYYGQCAEICGRYHHHMPIRICALPFEHFLLW
jgi:heme/copper-type cytochrome/quinol oxidase subunit 2